MQLDPRFREIDVGAWQGLSAAQVGEGWPDVQAALSRGEDVRRGDSGETMAEVSERVGAALTEHLDALGPGECLVVSTHGASGRTAAAWLLGLEHDARLAGARRAGQLPLGRARRGPRRVAHPDLERVVGGGVGGRVAAALRRIWAVRGAWVDSPSPLRGDTHSGL